MTTLRVPIALDEKKLLCYPQNAEKGRNYYCPSCKELIILRKGSIKVEHFAHKASNVCNQATITHVTAKLLVQKVICDWKTNIGPRPVINRKCEMCWEYSDQPLPDKIDDAILEYRLQDGSVADVALMVQGKAQAAIEIKVTHAVDAYKKTRLSVPYIELEGYEVISNPSAWKPISDEFKAYICLKCKHSYVKFKDKALKIASIIGIELPNDYYRYGLCKCWRCKREIIVFMWPTGKDSDSEKQIPPMPKTIQYRFSKTVGRKYWANTCPYCNNIQGDFFLHHEPESPFFGLCSDEIDRSFEEDLMKIAAYAEKLGLLN